MARQCEYCGKRTEVGNQVTHRGLPQKQGGIGLRCTGRTKREFKPNIQRVAAVVGGRTTRVKVCTRCLKAGKVLKPSRGKLAAST